MAKAKSKSALLSALMVPLLWSATDAACPDDFAGPALGAAWRFLDGDAVQGGAYALAGGKLELVGRGRDAFRDVNEFVGVWRQDITGDFDVAVKIESQTDTHDWAQAGILAASDISDLKKGGYVVLDVSPANGYHLFYDSAEPVGSLDKYIKAAGAATAYPVWLRLVKSSGKYSAWYRNKADAAWTSIAKDIVPVGAVAPSRIALFSRSHNHAMDGKTVFDDFECLHAPTGLADPHRASEAAIGKDAAPAPFRDAAGRRRVGTTGSSYSCYRYLPWISGSPRSAGKP